MHPATSRLPASQGLLILPHLRVQNANAISSPLTHGFPAMSAFLGLMWALARRLEPQDLPLTLDSVGVICHGFDEQTTDAGYTRAFRLTRNPVDKTGATAAIVEEGRIHLDITLVFGVTGGCVDLDAGARQTIAAQVGDTLAGLRIAGGSVLPVGRANWKQTPELLPLADNAEEARKQFRRLRRRLLPGFALVCRDDLLQARLNTLQQEQATATALDALLDLASFNWRPQAPDAEAPASPSGKQTWAPVERPGWIVPIPVGYGALSPLQAAGSVTNARDGHTPFRFVESLYSIGEWLGPHRLQSHEQLLWYGDSNPDSGLYRCRNDYAVSLQA